MFLIPAVVVRIKVMVKNVEPVNFHDAAPRPLTAKWVVEVSPLLFGAP